MAASVPAKKCRTVGEERRKFNEAWTADFFMLAIPSGTAMSCLICSEVIKTLKRSNAKQHFQGKHSAQFDKMSAECRKRKLEALINSNKSQKSLMRKPLEINQKATLASLKIAKIIAERGEQHNKYYYYCSHQCIVVNWKIHVQETLSILNISYL